MINLNVYYFLTDIDSRQWIRFVIVLLFLSLWANLEICYRLSLKIYPDQFWTHLHVISFKLKSSLFLHITANSYTRSQYCNSHICWWWPFLTLSDQADWLILTLTRTIINLQSFDFENLKITVKFLFQNAPLK